MNAIIIHSNEEYLHVVKEFPNHEIFASNFACYIQYKNSGLKYLFDLIPQKDIPEDINYLALNWYRDLDGLDIFSVNGVSLAPAITRRVISSFSNDYRNYLALRQISDNFESIFLSNSSPISFKRVAEVFDKKIKWFEFESQKYQNSSSPERTILSLPSIKFVFLSKLAYVIQSIFLSHIKKRILVWDDWTYRDQFSKRSDSLISNFYLPWKGFYFNYKKNPTEESKLIFPSELPNDKFTQNFLQEKLTLKGFNWDSNLVFLYYSTVKRVYIQSYGVLRDSYSCYKRLLLRYSPETLVFPGETHFAYLIGAQIAKNLRITSILVVDGYQVVGDDTIHYKNSDNSSLIFDKYVAFGEAQKKLYLNYVKIPASKVILSRTPLFNKLNSLNQLKLKYDAIVMVYLPHQINPNSRWDKRYFMTIDVVNLLKKMGFRNIALKLKDGDDKDEAIDFFSTQFEEYSLFEKPQLIFGEFSKYLKDTDLVIGQVSSALFEASCSKVNYIVYEPFENGLTDSALKQSTLLNRETIARDISELKLILLNSKASVIAKYEDLVSGNQIKQINF